jgi:hypothetical protein
MQHKPTTSSGKGSRAARLAAALKANLRKRKAQARARAETAGNAADTRQPPAATAEISGREPSGPAGEAPHAGVEPDAKNG